MIINRTKLIKYAYLILLFSWVIIPDTTFAMTPIHEVLKNTAKGTEGGTVSEVWKDLMAFVNGFGIAVLIAVAFSQILRINVNTYGVKKILPAMIIAIIAANFSYLFCRLVIDVSNVTSSILIEGAPNVRGLAQLFGKGGTESMGTLGAPSPDGNIFWFIIGQLLIIAGAIMIYILAYLLLIRNWVIYFLVALSPIAMMATVLPQTKSLFNQWWGNFIKWAFMPVVSLFWVWFGTRWYMHIDSGVYLLNYVYAGVCFYLAITTPFKMGGAIMGTWGKIGKKVSSPALDLAKRKATLAWTNQAASGNKLNPLGHLARIQTGWQDAKKFDEEKIANNRQAALARIMKSRSGRRRTEEREKFGGDVDKAKEEVLRDYLKTDAGKKWAEGRAEFLSEMNTAKAQKEAGLSGGIQRFRQGKYGDELAQDKLLADKDKEAQEHLVMQSDKELVIAFNNGEGIFSKEQLEKDHPEYQDLMNTYFATLTRNKELDEGVNQSANNQIKERLADQMHIENMKDEFVNIEKALGREVARIEQDNALQAELEARKVAGTITEQESRVLDTLQATRGRRDARKADIETNGETIVANRREELLKAADKYVKEVQGKGQHHLDGFISEDGKTIEGFAGTVKGDEEFRKSIGRTLMTRAGKLLSIEIKSDIDKLLDAKTPREIAEELITGEEGFFTKEELDNFRSGNREKNSTKANNRIEAHVLANSRTARRFNDPYNNIARRATINMLDEKSTLDAADAFNRMAAERNLPEEYRVNTAGTPTEMQVQLKNFSENRRIGSLVLAAVEDQPNVGLSNNPANYSSGGGGYREESAESIASTRPIDNTEPKEFTSSIGRVAMARGNYNPSLASDPNVVKQLDNIVDTLKSERNAITNEISRAAGINLNNETFKRTMNDVVMNIKKGTDSTSVLNQINTTIKQFGGKELDKNVQITIPSIAGQKTMDIGHAASRAQAASLGAQSGELIKMQPLIQEIKPQISFFGQMSGGKSAIDSSMKTLESVLNGPNGVRSPGVDASQIQKMVNDAVRKVGIGAAGVDMSFKNNDEAINFLKRTRDAASVASQGFSSDGKFDINKAHDAAAKYYLAQEKK